MKRLASFAAACLGIIGVTWMIAVLLFTEATVRRAFAITAVVAFVVQMIAFLVARAMARRENVIAGWGIGVALRFGALLIFGLVAVPALALPLAPALMSLATFLFVSTLIEPLFLKP